MLRWFKFRRELAKLSAWERRVQRDHAKKTQEAKKLGKPAPDEMDRVTDLWMVEDERNLLMSRRLLRQAYRYGVPTPAYDDKAAWEETKYSYERFLGVSAAAELRAAVRKEKSERWELRLKIMGILIPGVIGAIGALTGLVAVLLK